MRRCGGRAVRRLWGARLVPCPTLPEAGAGAARAPRVLSDAPTAETPALWGWERYALHVRPWDGVGRPLPCTRGPGGSWPGSLCGRVRVLPGRLRRAAPAVLGGPTSPQVAWGTKSSRGCSGGRVRGLGGVLPPPRAPAGAPSSRRPALGAHHSSLLSLSCVLGETPTAGARHWSCPRRMPHTPHAGRARGAWLGGGARARRRPGGARSPAGDRRGGTLHDGGGGQWR